MVASPLLAVLTWLDTAALCAVVGSAVVRLWIFAPSGRAVDAQVMTALHGVAGAGLLLLAGNCAALLWVRAASMGGVPLSAAAPLLPTVLLQTHYGTFWWLRVAAIALAIPGLLARTRRHGAVLLLFGAAGVAFSHSATGHAADAGDFSAREWLDTVHALAASAWVGMILVFLVAHGRARRLSVSAYAQSAARLSSAAGLSLDLVLFTGLYGAAAAFAGQWREILVSPYARLVALKLLLVTLMVAFGAFNRGVVARLRGATDGQDVLARRLGYSLRGELLVAAGVLAAAAVLVQTPPPGH